MVSIQNGCERISLPRRDLVHARPGDGRVEIDVLFLFLQSFSGDETLIVDWLRSRSTRGTGIRSEGRGGVCGDVIWQLTFSVAIPSTFLTFPDMARALGVILILRHN